MLNNQQNFWNKNGLGFQKRKRSKIQNKKSYDSKSKKHSSFINCFYCNQREHINDCYYRNETYLLGPNEKLLWLPKAFTCKSYALLFTNNIRPKMTRVLSSRELGMFDPFKNDLQYALILQLLT